MAKKRTGEGVSSGSKPAAAPGAKINKIDKYEDTLEPGSVDDFMFKRDQISFNDQNESDDEDINANEGEEVLSLKIPKKSKKAEIEDEGEYDDDGEEDLPKKKQRKEKKKIDLNGKGRFGKPIESSSDEDEDLSGRSDSDDNSEDDSDDENWGRQYYSKPSNRREKEDGKIDDEKREEEREMEEREVKRLQKKSRELLDLEDFGLIQDDDDDLSISIQPLTESKAEPQSVPKPALPNSNDPQTLLRHLQSNEPVKLALARDFPLIVKKLEKTSRGIKKMENEKGDGELHKGLGWLHYQTLLTYATTLAFYIHLSSLPPSERGDGEINIIPRLLQLKEGLAMLEDLDFAAGSVSDGAFNLNPRMGLGEDEDDEELKEGKLELLKRMQNTNGDEDEENEDDWEDDDEMDDSNDLWGKEGLEEGELEALLQDAEDDDEADELKEMIKLAEKSKSRSKKSKAKTSKSVDNEDDDDDMLDLDDIALDEVEISKKEKSKKKKEKKEKKSKTSSKAESSSNTAKSTPAFTPLAEPEFFSSAIGSSSSSSKNNNKYDNSEDDVIGDSISLQSADYQDKQMRKKSLAFHTSKINSTLARREQGRMNRMGGDEDLPYRDKRKSRDDALKRNQVAQPEGEDLDVDADVDSVSRPYKRSRKDQDDEDATGDDDDTGDYYELVKRRRKEEKDAKDAENDQYQADKLTAIASYDDITNEGGPRGLTRAIEKNRGLTPNRSKSKGGRNPRVKKRQQYEKAQKKLSSQRSVYKGGENAYGSQYKGEKTGISKVIKSRKF
ncbi:uncharacterized protein L201_003316 [Kwoniella dendrophila CBS 6074]|uniref:Sas10 C-terminal domain-containing protein n=1 Tax=Kwoniella dendrophila CBS 6074 TaxID=1295534 RepID=A0AAX4JSP3_9TREE